MCSFICQYFSLLFSYLHMPTFLIDSTLLQFLSHKHIPLVKLSFLTTLSFNLSIVWFLIKRLLILTNVWLFSLYVVSPCVATKTLTPKYASPTNQDFNQLKPFNFFYSSQPNACLHITFIFQIIITLYFHPHFNRKMRLFWNNLKD